MSHTLVSREAAVNGAESELKADLSFVLEAAEGVLAGRDSSKSFTPQTQFV